MCRWEGRRFEASIGMASQVWHCRRYPFTLVWKFLESSQHQLKPRKQICEESERVAKPEALPGTLVQLRQEGKQQIYLALVGRRNSWCTGRLQTFQV